MAEKIGLEAVLEMSNWNKGVSRYMTDTGKMEKRTGGLVGKLGSVAGSIGKVGLVAAGAVAAAGAGLAAGMTAIVATGVKAAADFESQIAILGVAAGGADASLQQLKDTALAVGADTSLVGVSASQAADAMTGLYKAGLTTNDIFGDMQGYLAGTTELSGALRAAVDLQAASSLDLASASDLVAVAMATFGLEAEDATRISDNFVQAADASVAEVEDLGAALRNVGPTAAQFGWTLEDTNNALAILSTRGISGSEAGTALKSMMTNLMRPTAKTKDAIADLGLELYNADGTMRELPDIISQLASSMEGLTEEQRNQYIQTLAGTYGMKAMAVFLDEGVAGWDAMAEATANAGTAQEVAAARTNTFEGAMEALDGVMETLKIQIGDAFLPVLTELIRKFGDFVAENGPAIADVFRRIGEWLGDNLPGAIQTASDYFTGTLWPAIQEGWRILNENVIPALTTVYEWLATNLPPAIQTLSDFWTGTLQPALQAFWDFVQANILPVLQTIFDWLSVNLPPAIQTLADFWTTTLQPALQTFADFVVNTLIPALTDIWNFINANILPVLGAFLDVVIALGELGFKVLAAIYETALKPMLEGLAEAWNVEALQTFVDWIGNLTDGVGGLIAPVEDIVAGLREFADYLRDIKLPDWLTPGSPTPWEKALESLGNLVKGGLLKAFGTLAKAVTEGFTDIYDMTVDWDELLQVITDETLPSLQDVFQQMSELILDYLAEIIRVTNLWKELLEYITNTTIPALQSAFQTMANAVLAALREIISKTNEWRDALAEVIKKVGELKKDWADAFDEMLGKVNDLIAALVGDKGLLAAMGEVSGAIPDFRDDFVDAINDIIEVVKKLEERLQAAIDKWKWLMEHGAPIADVAFGGAIGTATLPTMPIPAFAGAGATTNNVNLSFGPTTINNGMDQALFEGRVKQTVRDAMRGL